MGGVQCAYKENTAARMIRRRRFIERHGMWQYVNAAITLWWTGLELCGFLLGHGENRIGTSRQCKLGIQQLRGGALREWTIHHSKTLEFTPAVQRFCII